MTYLARWLRRTALSTTLVLGAVAAQAETRIAIGTASTGSNPYVIGSVLAQTVGEATGYDISVQTTGGYNENVGLVGTGQIGLALNFLPDLIDAYEQKGKFEKVAGTPMFKNLRVLFPVYLATYHYITRADAGITSFDELKGKRFNVNVPSTATHGLNMALIEALGDTPEDFKIVNLSGKDTYDALRNRLTDASGTSVQIGGGPLLELASSVPIHLLPIPDAAFEKLNAAVNSALVRTVIPANSYPGQTEDTPSYSVPTVLFAAEDMDEETVYQFTKAYWENWEKMVAEAHTLGDATIEMAAKPQMIPMHPGAARYFRERGLLQ